MLVSGKAERQIANCRCDRGADHCGKDHKLQHIKCSIEWIASFSETAQEVNGGQSFGGITDRNCRRRNDWYISQQIIRQQCPQDHARRSSITEPKQRGDGDASWRPYRRYADVDKRQRQSNLSAGEIRDGDADTNRDVSPFKDLFALAQSINSLNTRTYPFKSLTSNSESP